jgi:hypothetical protein
MTALGLSTRSEAAEPVTEHRENANLNEYAPSMVTLLLSEADTRIQEHLRKRRGQGRGFVASDFTFVNAALERIVAEDLARGPLFCEWGSGFGVVAMLASMHGFAACGIEVQSELVEAAEELAADFDCDVRFAHGSFVTPCGEELTETAENPWWHSGERSAYGDLDMDVEEFDLFFAYPWPGEESLFDALFTQCAGVGAILLTYHDGGGVLVQRKTESTDVLEVVGWY